MKKIDRGAEAIIRMYAAAISQLQMFPRMEIVTGGMETRLFVPLPENIEVRKSIMTALNALDFAELHSGWHLMSPHTVMGVKNNGEKKFIAESANDPDVTAMVFDRAGITKLISNGVMNDVLKPLAQALDIQPPRTPRALTNA